MFSLTYIYISTNLQADGFTAIKSWVIACIVFVFGAMLEYSGILLLVKLEKMNIRPLQALYPVKVKVLSKCIKVWVAF